MDHDTAMAAAVAQPRPQPPRAATGSRSRRGFFTFLKDGVLITTRNLGLFLPLAALHAARFLARLAARTVALRYMGPTLGLNANGEDGFRFSTLLDKLLDGGNSWLLPAGAACLVVKVSIMVLGLAIEAATACAAVASCSAASIDGGGPGRATTLTLTSLLGKVLRPTLRGPTTTAVCVNVMWWAFFVRCVLTSVSVLASVEALAGPSAATLVTLLLLLVAILFFFSYTYACEVAVVVSVAEPGLRAGGALRRAHRLTRGTKKMAQATLHSMLSMALNRAVYKMYDVAMARVPYSMVAAIAPFWLDVVVVYMLVGAVEVLHTATVTAYYYDCKRNEEETAGHIHVE